MSSEAADRRREERLGAHFDVRFHRATDAARALNAFSVNFSAGGLCVRTRSQYAVGEQLTMSLTIEGQTFELACVVAWVRGEAVGVRFVQVHPDDRKRLEVVAKSLAARAARPP